MILLVVAPTALVTAYVSGLYIYNVYFHPLRTYPGPKLFAAFRFPYVYNQLRGRLPIRVKELHDTYGHVVRIAPDELSYVTAKAWKDIHGYRPGHAPLPKDRSTYPPLPEGLPPDISHSDGATHSRQRRLLSHALTAKALEEQHPLIMSYVELLIHGLHNNSAKPQDMVAWYDWITFDVIGDLVLGNSFDCLERQRYHPWINTILEGVNGGVAIAAAGRYGLSGPLIALIPRSMKKNFDSMYEYARVQVAQRLKRGAERPDFTSHLMRNDKDRKEMSQQEIEANAWVLILAGSETIASALSGASYQMMTNPRVLRRATEEVRAAFSAQEKIDCSTASRLDYLTAVLKESLRVYPPAPSSFPRMVVSAEGECIDGQWVPPHTTVGLFQWACNHSASNFFDPESFQPERWLDTAPPEFASDSREAMQPFSLSPRNCLGKNLAWVEMRVIMARMLWNFDLGLEPTSENWMDQKAYLMWAKHPLMAKLTPVKKGV